MRTVTLKQLNAFKAHLNTKERAHATTAKYLHDVTVFARWLCENELSSNTVVRYKAFLCEQYAASSVNSMLSSLNSFFEFMQWHDLRIKLLKIQKRIFAPSERELSKQEYSRLFDAAKQKKNRRLYLLLQTICSTGIRVSELRFITVSAIACGSAEINCKGKRRQVLLPKQLCKMLKQYISDENIKNGPVFITKNGLPLDRSNIWSDMKKLCRIACVSDKKVFPHNLRHLFARTYYSLHKDIARLADILGHSSINTTRIYTMESGETHLKHLQMLGLLRC